MSKNPKKKSGGKRVALIVLIVVLSVILVTLIAGTVFVTGMLNKIDRPVTDETLSQAEIDIMLNEETEPVDENFTGEVLTSDEVNLSDTPADVVAGGDNTVRILLVGQDARDKTTRSRSDSMILCTINKSTATLTMTSFMRDTYVKIPGYFNQRVNVAYMLGGFETLYDTLEHNFGVQVDQGVAVNFFAFGMITYRIIRLDFFCKRMQSLRFRFGQRFRPYVVFCTCLKDVFRALPPQRREIDV